MSLPISPYKGLVPYSEDDAAFFFGRDREKQTIGLNLRGSRLTILYGPTGVGKSSVLRAGVSYDLRKLAAENVEANGRAEFVVVVMSSYSDDPVKELIHQIGKSVGDIAPGTLLTSTPITLIDAIQQWSEELKSDLLIILDQFEEYFLYRRQSDLSGTFASEFCRAVNDTNLRANFLISVREDALSALDVFKERIPTLFDNYLRIEHLGWEAAHEAIQKPIGVYNIKAEPARPFRVQRRLVHEVCKQVAISKGMLRDRLGSTVLDKTTIWLPNNDARIEAPLLQLVMTRLWEEEAHLGSHVLRLHTLQTLGSAYAIVKEQLARQLQALPEDERDVAADVFHYLVTPTGWKSAHTLKDLAAYAGHPEEVIEPVVSRFSGSARILRAVPSSLEADYVPRYEIFHDLLAPAVTDWVSAYRQEKAVREERAELDRKQKLVERDRARAHRRARNNLIGSGVGMILVALFLVLYLSGKRKEEEATKAQIEALAEKQKLAEQVKYITELEKTIPYLKIVLKGHTGIVNKALFSPNGKDIATSSEDGTVRLWDVESGQSLHVMPHYTPIADIAFHPSGNLLATAANDRAYLWSTESGVIVMQIRIPDIVSRVGFSPDGTLLTIVGNDRTIRIVDAATGRIKHELKGHTGAITDAAFSNDGQFLVTASADFTARVWNVNSGELISDLKGGHVNVINSARFSPDGRQVVTASDDWTARLWDWRARKTLWVLKSHTGPVHYAEFAPDAQLIVTSAADKLAKVWDVKARRILSQLRGHDDDVVSARFSPDGSRVITASADHTARIWQASTGNLLYDLRAHIRAVKSAYFGPGGKIAVTASTDDTARVWSVGEAGVIRVTELRVSADPNIYSGPCPSYLRVFGRISVAGESGLIRYKFVERIGSSENARAEHTVSFDGPGTKEVGTVYKLGSPNVTGVSGSFYLQILPPNELRSNEVSFQVRCEQAPKEDKPKEEKPKEEKPKLLGRPDGPTK